MNGVKVDKLAFELEEDGFHIMAHYLHEPEGHAVVDIRKDGKVIRSFLWPAYKIWNIAAHASDIISDLQEGLAVAGSDGLGGGCAPVDLEAPDGTD